MFNKSIVVGHLGNDPEMVYAASGMAICSLSVATSYVYKKEKKTEWHRIKAFNKLAEICGEYLKKGSLVVIEGRSQQQKYTDKEGITRYSHEIIADQMKILSSPKADNGAQAPKTTEEKLDSMKPKDDIPF